MDYELKKERLYYRSPMPYLMAAAELKTFPERESLISAVEKAVRRHETLGCKLVESADGTLRFTERETPRMPEISYSDVAFTWEKAIADVETRAFDFADGEFVRFFVYPMESAEGCTFVCAAAQVTADVTAVSILLSDILTALADPKADFVAIPAQFCDIVTLSKDVKLPFSMKFMLKSINKTWKKGGIRFSDADYAAMYERQCSRHPKRTASASIEGEQLAVLETYAQTHSMPICDLITAAVLLGTEESGFGTAVNIRDEGNLSFTNHSAGVSANYFPSADTSFTSRAEELHRLLEARRGDNAKIFYVPRFLSLIDPTLLDAAWFAAYGSCTDPLAVRMASLAGFLSKSTQLHVSAMEKQTSPLLRSVTFLPSFTPGVGYLAGFVQMPDKLTVTVCTSDTARHTPEEVLATALRLLKSV